MSWLRPKAKDNAQPNAGSSGPANQPTGSSFFGSVRQQQAPQPQQQQQQQQQQYQQGSLRGGNPVYGGGAPASGNAQYPGYPQQQLQGQFDAMAVDPVSAGNSASSMRSPSVVSDQSTGDSGASAQTLAPNGLPSANQNPSSSVKRTGILVIRVMEARNLVYPPGSQQLMARYAPYKNEAHQRPYAVVEFDKNEAVVTSLGGDMQNPIWKYRVSFDVSRTGPVMVSLYQRTAELQHQRAPQPRGFQRFGNGNSGNASAANGQGRGGQQAQPLSGGQAQGVTTGAIFLGAVQIMPDFADNRLYDDWIPLLGGAGNSGHIRVQYCFNKKDSTPLNIEQFDLLKVIGKGSFGKVMQVRKRDTNRIYAMKILSKSKIVMRSEVAHTLAERNVLAKINHPFIVPLKFSFQTPEKLYLVLAFINGGELFHHLQREGRFDQHRSRFYAAELLSALDCLHSYNVVYRDLKPENILLDYSGHIALCDFGLCKLNMGDNETTNTFCGTPEYLAPELLQGRGYTKTVDWWTFGVLLYEMMTGLPPFYDENVNEMYRRILEDELVFSVETGNRAKSLLRGLLQRDPRRRLGNNGASEIKDQPFFAEINWDYLIGKQYEPPFKPSVASAIDTSNFDEEFTTEPPKDSYIPDSNLSETVQEQFVGFTYDGSGGAMSLAQSMTMSNMDNYRN
ncbi:Serine/threonine-protein kinase [Coemansia sp. RSA 1722]|nr:Serine/threonine-protein kinase [Coemansia sp. RSA 1722]